jgi:predicted nuclease with TOPRIM domain
LRDELSTSETAQEDLRQISMKVSDELESKTQALEKVSIDRSRLQDRISKLHKEVRRLRAKTLRAPQQRSHAVDAAVTKAIDRFNAESNPWRIKRPDGRIENWVRDLVCRLITIRHLPASQTPGAISDILQAIKANTDGVDVPNKKEIFSDRSARRFPLEGHVMGKIMVAQEIKAAPG